MTIYNHNRKMNKLTPIMKDVLIILDKEPKIDTELLEIIPNFSFSILGKLRDLDAIDHNGHLIYITTYGEKLLADIESNIDKE
jgi:hypothetical protein